MAIQVAALCSIAFASVLIVTTSIVDTAVIVDNRVNMTVPVTIEDENGRMTGAE
jgi:hypothetical protein